ncbi:Uncharacterized protein ALO63_02484 [Pseudomonas amygdali pv. mori]|uniref:Uncharacterized protein n=1 Tax=Pseudomonas amygdali pv. mori TaxID=34065 RepID=A0A0P9VAJ8_PSEA0|nr:Uncharacterized protein ALO63_02484 [Pseudomonas amygdali pv. mori]
MTDVFMVEVKRVRELTEDRIVNQHLADGWVLLLVRSGQDMGQNPETGQWELSPCTSYTLAWRSTQAPKTLDQYSAERESALSSYTDWV